MTPYEQFIEWLDECPCKWEAIGEHYGEPTLKFFPDETHDEDEDEDEDEYDWRTHPSLTAEQRNPSLR